MAFKLNNSDEYIHLCNVRLSDYPQIFKLKCEELVEEGCAKDIEEAKEMAKDWETELEIYYEKGYGLFAVDSEAVTSGTIYSPYSAELGEDPDDEDIDVTIE